jgi:hypothetical protein
VERDKLFVFVQKSSTSESAENMFVVQNLLLKKFKKSMNSQKTIRLENQTADEVNIKVAYIMFIQNFYSMYPDRRRHGRKGI